MLIELGIINYQIILPLIYPLTFHIRRIIHQNDKPFYDIFTHFLGYLLSGIVFIIIEYRTKSSSIEIENKNENQEEKVEENIEENVEENFEEKYEIKNTFKQIDEKNKRKKESRIKGKYLNLFILNLIYLIPIFLEAFAVGYINLNFKASVYLFYIIFFYILFSRTILHLPIYNHQLLSIIIIVACIPILLVFYFTNSEEKDKSLLFSSLLLLFTGSLYSLFNILEKRYYNKYMDSPYHFMFIIGLISLCILIPYEILTFFLFGENTDFNGILFQIKNNYNKYSYLYPLLFIGDILVSFLWGAGIHLTFYFLQPCHFIISESLCQIISTFINGSIQEYSTNIKIIIYILYVIICAATLIYNEVIIINVGNLSVNTKKKIISREIIEKEKLSSKINEKDLYNNKDDTTTIY